MEAKQQKHTPPADIVQRAQQTDHDTKAELLFQHKEGRVNVYVWGPRKGFLYRDVDYFRWGQSTKEPGKWLKIRKFSERDQPQLEKCVKEVRAWFKKANAGPA